MATIKAASRVSRKTMIKLEKVKAFTIKAPLMNLQFRLFYVIPANAGIQSLDSRLRGNDNGLSYKGSRYRSFSIFLLAVFAHAEQAVVVKNKSESVLPANFILKLFNFWALKFNEFAAPDTDHMIVVAAGTEPFEKFTLAFAYRLLNNAAFQKKRDRAVNCVAGNP